MSSVNEILLSTAYLPPVEYISLIARASAVSIEKCENYQKQSYRSRCHIYSANGLLPLTIPIVREIAHNVSIKDTKIDFSKDWQSQHWRAIVSAYKSSPFFEYYQDDFVPFYARKEKFLFDYNTKLLLLILELTGVNKEILFTSDFNSASSKEDYRTLIHPKIEPQVLNTNGRYYQVFAHKKGFLSNLSIIDLLFNEGPNSISYLI